MSKKTRSPVKKAPPVAPKPFWSRGRVAVAAAVAVLAAVTPGFLLYIGVLGGNVRVVVPGKLYRSATITGKQLSSVLDGDHIKTVINLRGSHWSGYAQEYEECQRRNIKLVDVPLSASAMPPPQQLKDLIETFDHGAYPMLFHCQGGADRSGLVGTLYLMLYKHVPVDQAERQQLTWRYGHFKWGEAHAMDAFFDLYRRTSHGQDLRDWIETVYPVLYNGPRGAAAGVIIGGR